MCLISLKESLIKFLETNKLNITVNLIADNSNETFDKKLTNIIKSDKYLVINHTSKIKGNRGSYLECCDLAEKAEDLIFFIEDDYLFEQNCIEEMLNTFSKISSLIKNDIIICPSDYPFYYDSLYATTLFVGHNYKWRKVSETLLTYMFSKKILINYRDNIRKVGNTINEPFEKPLHDLYEKVNCLAPINSLSYHLSRSVPSVHEDWMRIWDDNFKKYNKITF